MSLPCRDISCEGASKEVGGIIMFLMKLGFLDYCVPRAEPSPSSDTQETTAEWIRREKVESGNLGVEYIFRTRVPSWHLDGGQMLCLCSCWKSTALGTEPAIHRETISQERQVELAPSCGPSFFFFFFNLMTFYLNDVIFRVSDLM